MEYLDAYDEAHNPIGTYSYEEVHEKGLWHNTVHCWLYDKDGNIFFQIRSSSSKLYTTASGHVKAGETIKEAFGRETKEEIGIDVNYEDAKLIDIVIWKMDKEKNGKLTKDRAFANVYKLLINDADYQFSFVDGEVNGIVKMRANDILSLFHDETEAIEGILIDKENNYIPKTITKEDFLVQKGETLLEKYGFVLNSVLED